MGVVTTTSPLLLARADRVILLDERVVAVGTHAELLGREERYRDVVLRGTEEQSKSAATANARNARHGTDASEQSESEQSEKREQSEQSRRTER